TEQTGKTVSPTPALSMVNPVVKPENRKIKRPLKLNVQAVFRIGVTGFEPTMLRRAAHLGPEGLGRSFFVYLQGFRGILARNPMVCKHLWQTYLRVFRSRIW
ncbi:MAG: hypothetical protein K6G29_02590, partial [Clostridiales bacterium]|nr:hypothetical protein [Clostridiales bacterium]